MKKLKRKKEKKACFKSFSFLSRGTVSKTQAKGLKLSKACKHGWKRTGIRGKTSIKAVITYPSYPIPQGPNNYYGEYALSYAHKDMWEKHGGKDQR